MKTRVHCKSSACRKWSKLNPESYCPSCKPAELDVVEVTDESSCDLCNKTIQEEDNKVIGCDLCEHWFHQKCIGSDKILQLLEAINVVSSNTDAPSADTFLGNMLWFCPKCLETPKVVTISKDSCKTNVPMHDDNSHETTGRNKPICKKYRYGKCADTTKCNFSHPAKCLQYCRYGRDGCKGGFSNCQLLHPVICRGSLNSSKCFDPNCTLSHLKGTIRNRETRSTGIYQSSQTRRNSKYSPFDPQKLGFHRFPQDSNRDPLSSGFNQTNENYVYNPNDYPTLHAQHSSQEPRIGRGNDTNDKSNQNAFLELVNQIQSMQDA